MLQGVVFDLDGVLTSTANLHFDAWKRMFDPYLISVGQRAFSHTDYVQHVDGRPRYDGVAAFLASRSIHLPRGTPVDPPGHKTICALGNRKNEIFGDMLRPGNIKVLEDNVAWLRLLRAQGYKTGVASSSKNARTVLELVGLVHEVDAIVDGIVSAERGLKGKPRPDIFLECCHLMSIQPECTVVVEDALSGVAAGRAGNFGLVLGITNAAGTNRTELEQHGADRAVRTLAEMTMPMLLDWFSSGHQRDGWVLAHSHFDSMAEATHEALMSIGNGYFGTRAAAEEIDASDPHYPGTYIAGLYNIAGTPMGDRIVKNEDLVNCPNWLCIRIRIGDDPAPLNFADRAAVKFTSFHRCLDFGTGVLHRRITILDQRGRETRIESRRFASMANPHMAAMQYTVQPVNYDSVIEIGSGIDAGVINHGVKRYRKLESRHLDVCGVAIDRSGAVVSTKVRTKESQVEVGTAARTSFEIRGRKAAPVAILPMPAGDKTATRGWSVASASLRRGQTFVVEKVVAMFTTTDRDGIAMPDSDVCAIAERNVAKSDFGELLAASQVAWRRLWHSGDLVIDGDRWAQKAARFMVYQMYVAASPHNEHIDAGITARGLAGEAYRGKIFWDQAYILPFYSLTTPATARALLEYRVRRLEQARINARETGERGAMYPWQSGRTGDEQTQVVHLNPMSGRWDPDHSHLQRHVSLAVAYDVWHYVNITGDVDFLRQGGAEMLFEIARYWVSKCQPVDKGLFSIGGVMGPDEFHESTGDKPGLVDNAYTNVMAMWLLQRVPEVIQALGEDAPAVLDKIQLTEVELRDWGAKATRIRVRVSPEGVLEQFHGFFDLAEVDWEKYRKKYGKKTARMDRVLKAEGDSPDRYKVLKQADTLMIWYLLDPNDVLALLQRSGAPLPQGMGPRELLAKNFDYYYPRTSHGSTLSALVHGTLAETLGRDKLAASLFRATLSADLHDVQGGTTGEGLHIGSISGCILWVINHMLGITTTTKKLRIDPNQLPKGWTLIQTTITFRGSRVRIRVTPHTITVDHLSGFAPLECELDDRPGAIVLPIGHTVAIRGLSERARL